MFQDNLLRFNTEEKQFYSELRSCIKIWDTPLDELYCLLMKKYEESNTYHSGCCKPIARDLRLYDIYGVTYIDGHPCDNTLLDMVFIPRFDYYSFDSRYLEYMAEFAGITIAAFGITEKNLFSTSSITIKTEDYGGFIKSPIGEEFNVNYVLFSILCSINFLIYGIEGFIRTEIPLKLRLAYIQYFYLVQQLPSLNAKLGSSFSITNKWYDSSSGFRNCMAHYGLGSIITQEEAVVDDSFGGITHKFFGIPWIELKIELYHELQDLSNQITDYLIPHDK